MISGRLRLVLALVAAILVGGLIGYVLHQPATPVERDPATVADAALISVREEGRLIALTARFAAVVTASETKLGMTARKTLILPGTIRYGVDLTRLKRSNLAWDKASKTLTVTLPPLELSNAKIEFENAQEYAEGGMLMAFTDSEKTLDEANHRSAQDDLMRQARAPLPLQTARNTAMRMVARSFAIPLRAAGIDASVATRFLDPSGREEAIFLDRAPRVEDQVHDRQAGQKPAG